MPSFVLSALVNLSTFFCYVAIASVRLVGNVTSFIRFSVALIANISLLTTTVSMSASLRDCFLCTVPIIVVVYKRLAICHSLPPQLSGPVTLLHHHVVRHHAAIADA